ncbi:MAG: ABC transporter permease [Thermoanaerobaculia bacterium]
MDSVRPGQTLLAADTATARTRRRYRGPWISLTALCVMLLLWEIAARLAWISPLFFPAPSSIGRYMFTSTRTSYLAAAALTTMRRVFTGLACGIVPAAVLGLLIGWSERLRRVVDPFLAALHPIPKIALFPLLIVIFGLGETPQIVSIAIGSFFPWP